MNDKGNDLSDPTLPEVVTVTVKEAVSGVKQRKKYGPRKPRQYADTHQIVVDQRVMAAAKALLTQHTRIQIISETEVRLVNR